MTIIETFNKSIPYRVSNCQVTVKGFEIESGSRQCILNVMNDTSLDGVNIFWHIVSHDFVKFISHSRISFIRGDSINRSLKVSRLIYMSQALFTCERESRF